MPVTYLTSTYEEVLRWTADTRIQYIKNPKQPTSKSFVRYAQYAKARTVGKSLEFGSKPQDLFFDYEHGYIKVLGGPKRKKPLEKLDDSQKWTHTDQILQNMHLKWKTWTKTFKIAEELGVDRRQLTSNKNGSESTEVHVGRLKAQEMAKLVLQDVEKTGRKVTDRDVLACLRLWGFKQNGNRHNVMKEGQEFVFSDTLGVLGGYDGSVIVPTSTTHYPEFIKVVTRWLDDHLPPSLKQAFRYTSINVNADYAAALHRDSNNEGPSLIKAFGEFTGGELNYWPDDDKYANALDDCKAAYCTTTDIQKKLVLFDGNRGHSVQDFEGQRFSIVFFTVSKYARANAGMRQALENLGIRYPDEQAMEKLKGLLGAPTGYHEAALGRKSKSTKAKHFAWPCEDKRPTGKNFLALDMVKEATDNAAGRNKELAPTECLDTKFVDSNIEHYIAPDKRRGVRVTLRGMSGNSYVIVDALEERLNSGRYQYEKLSTFPYGPNLCTHRIADVKQWISKVVKPIKGKSHQDGVKRCLRSDLSDQPPRKRSRNTTS